MSGVDDPTCPCEGFEHPHPARNPAGLSTISYRAGDFVSFRRALLAARPGERALAAWRPGSPGSGDLAVQMLEWWAYVADVLTFYGERIASESFLRTAILPESTRRLVRLLGYRPRPGIGASVLLAGVLGERRPVALPRGFAVQSKPRPGAKPQIFELDEDTTLGLPDAVAADAAPDAHLKGKTSLLVAGKVTSVKVGDRLLLLARRFADDGTGGYAVVQIDALTIGQDPRGRATTRVDVRLLDDHLPADAQVADYRLVRSRQQSHPWLYLSTSSVASSETHLESSVRSLGIGTPVLFDLSGAHDLHLEIAPILTLQAMWSAGMGALAVEKSVAAPAKKVISTAKKKVAIGPRRAGGWHGGGAPFALVRVSSYAEQIWYANGKNGDPETPPTAEHTPAIAILHSVISYPTEAALSDVDPRLVTVHHDFVDIGALLPVPATTLGPAQKLLLAAGARFPTGRGLRVLVEDAEGEGMPAYLDSTDGLSAELRWPEGASFSLRAPFRVHFDVLPMSRGQSVLAEVLGSGDPTRTGQELVLQKSPLTYLPSSDPGDPGYRSTLRVYVNGVAWREVPSFYGQAADARVFVTREDDAQKTYVRFGDGVHGARVPAGRDNITADYRFGSGASAPPAATLTNVLRPVPGLRGVRNPVGAGGGDDPDPPAQLRRYAPRSVLTFGRAVSADDYEVMAARAPGVTRARAVSAWDDEQQRTLVTVHVGDDAAAVASAREALRAFADPNRPKRVVAATPAPVELRLTIEVAAGYRPADVAAAVRTAVLDREHGPFAPAHARIGEPLFDSQIDDVCLAVPGAQAVHGLSFVAAGDTSGPRHRPPPGGFFVLAPEQLAVSAEEAKRG